MMTKVMILMAMITLSSLSKIMVLDDASDLRALLGKDILPTKHKQVWKNIEGFEWTHGVEAVGLAKGNGLLWSVICQDTPKGNIPCRVDAKGNAYYPWGGLEAKWTNFSGPINGDLYWPDEKLPSDCKLRGHETDSKTDFYAALVHTKYGSLPGKAKKDLTMAWYSWGGKEIHETKRFQIIC